ncbi:MAG: hypothetical protein MZV70_54075 [Desulfobacterales bacterium]|nr:hypothetical protein [Desulfobacterales bacterium]
MERAVSSPVAARRLELVAAARAEPLGFLRFEPGKLRFSLGTSLADLAVPVELAPGRPHHHPGRCHRGDAAPLHPPQAAGAARRARPAAPPRGVRRPAPGAPHALAGARGAGPAGCRGHAAPPATRPSPAGW